MTIICPVCGNSIEIQDESVKAVQCSCGNLIQNFADISGSDGFDTTIDLNKLKEQRIKASKKQFRIFCIVYNFFLLLTIGLLIFLICTVDSNIPLFTIPPVTVFMIIGEIIFISSFRKTIKRMGDTDSKHQR